MPPKKTKSKAETPKESPSKAKNNKKYENISTIASSITSIVESQKSQRPDSTNLLKCQYVQDASDNEDLVIRLKKVGQVLKDISQDEFSPSTWENSFPQLFMDKKYITHKDREVRLRVACLFADIFRLTVVDQPYDSSDLKKIFKLLVQQFSGLDDTEDALFSSYFYLLEKLATTKVFLLLTDPELEAMDLVEEVFATFFQVISSKFEQKVSGYMSDIMISVLETSEVVSPRLLEILLTPLLNKSEDQAAYNLARYVLDKSSDYIVTNLAAYLTSELTGLDKTKTKYKTKRAHIFGIIAELNQISTKLLLYIMPNITGMIKDEDVAERGAVIQLLAKMFAVRESTLVHDYKQTLEEFFGRAHDLDPGIRTTMIKSCVALVKSHPGLCGKVCDLLDTRLMDQDDKVRRCAVEVVAELARENPAWVTDSLLIKTGERFRDKKDLLRTLAMKLFGGLYRKHPNEAKFAWIPEKIISLYSDTSLGHENANFIESLLVEDILPMDDPDRINTLTCMMTHLSQNGMVCLKKILAAKKRFREALKAKKPDEYSSIIEKHFKKTKISTECCDAIKDLLADGISSQSVAGLEKHFSNDILKHVWYRLVPFATFDQIEKLLSVPTLSNFQTCSLISDYFPTLFTKHLNSLISMIAEETTSVLYILKNLSGISEKKLKTELCKILTNTDQKQVKFASIILAKNYPDGCKSIYNDIVSRLEKQDYTCCPSDLIVLRQFAKLIPSQFRKKSSLISDLVIENIDDFKSTGVKLIYSYLQCLSTSGVSVDSEDEKAKCVKFLFESLSSNIVEVKRTATQGVLKICTIPEYQKNVIKYKEFLTIAYLILDDDVSDMMISKITIACALHKLPLKFCAILFLRQDSIKNLSILISTWFLQNQARSPPMTLDNEKSVLVCPEYIFPPLIHLLVNHPEFETEEPNFATFTKIFYNYFDVCLGENLGFFHQLIAKLKLRKDVIKGGDGFEVQKMCDLSSAVLNAKSADGKYPLAYYPGNIFIPGFFKEAEGISLKNSYLDPNFKLNEKKKAHASPRKKKEDDTTSPGKRKRLEDGKSPAKKKKDEEVTPRGKSKRSTKSKKKLMDSEDEEDEYQTSESEEETIKATPKRTPRRTPGKTPKKVSKKSESEQSEMEEEKPVEKKTVKGGKGGKKKVEDSQDEMDEEEKPLAELLEDFEPQEPKETFGRRNMRL